MEQAERAVSYGHDEPVERPPIVQHAAERLEVSVVAIGELLDTLEHRLGPVLGQTRPEAMETPREEMFEVPLAQMLAGIQKRADVCSDRIRGLLARLEV
jgi:hypothetical protein